MSGKVDEHPNLFLGVFAVIAGTGTILLWVTTDAGLFYNFYRKIGTGFGAGLIAIGILLMKKRSKAALSPVNSWLIPLFVLVSMIGLVVVDATLVERTSLVAVVTFSHLQVFAVSLGVPIGVGIRVRSRVQVATALGLVVVTLLVMSAYTDRPFLGLFQPFRSTHLGILATISVFVGYAMSGTPRPESTEVQNL